MSEPSTIAEIFADFRRACVGPAPPAVEHDIRNVFYAGAAAMLRELQMLCGRPKFDVRRALDTLNDELTAYFGSPERN